MKLKITVSGVVDLDKKDATLLKTVGAEAVVDTLKFQCARMDVKIENVRDRKAAENKAAGAARAAEGNSNGEV